jgi:hypothetical protein
MHGVKGFSLSLSLSLSLAKKFEKMLSLEAKVIMGRGIMAQCEKVTERERERERKPLCKKGAFQMVACFLNNTLRACLRWSQIPPRMGPDPTFMGPDSTFTSHGPDSTHIGPDSTLYGPDSTHIEA